MTLGVVVLNGQQLGLIIVAIFGALWAAVGASVLRSAQRSGITAVAAIVALLLIMQAPRLRAGAGYFHAGAYVYSVLFEVVAIFLTVVLIRRFADRSLIPPVIAIIVGLHFIGLRLATGQNVFIWLAVAMCLFGTLAAITPQTLRLPIAGFGSALALWASAIRMIAG